MQGALSVSPLRAQQAALLRHASFGDRSGWGAQRDKLCASGQKESTAVGSQINRVVRLVCQDSGSGSEFPGPVSEADSH